MNCISENDLKLLIQRYQEHDFDLPAMRDIRSKIIHVVGTHFDQTHASKKSGLNQKLFERGLCDGFLKVAEDVLKGDALSDFPGSLLRLMPLAESYISEWNQLFDAISQVSAAELELGALDVRIDSFVHSHDLFSQQYIQERTIVRQDTDLGVRLSLSNTLKFFYCFMIDFLDNQPELGNQLRQAIEEMDGKAFLLLPHLVILQQIKNKDYPCPEILEKFKPDLQNLHDLYHNLTKEEQFTLETHLFDERCDLSESACKIHLKIREIVYRLHENELAQPFTNCFRTLISDLNCDLAIADKLKMDLEKVMIHRTEVDVSELLYALLHVSPTNLELLFPLLPQLRNLKSFAEKFSLSDGTFRNEVKDFLMESKRIDSNPEFMTIAAMQSDLQNDPDLYRLFAMLLLATKK